MCLNIFLIVKVLVGAFNKEKALVGASSKYCEKCHEVSLPALIVTGHN